MSMSMLPQLSFSRYLRRYKKLIFFLTCLLFFLSVLFLVRAFFSIKNVEVSGNRDLRGLQSLGGRLIFTIDEGQLEAQLKALNPQLQKIEIKKKFPNKLEIKTQSAKISAVLEAGSGYFYLSADGRILAKSRKKDKVQPVIKYYQKYNYDSFGIGDKIEENDILFALQFIEKFESIDLIVHAVDITSTNMLILNSGDKTYFLSTERSIEDQYRDVKTIVGRFKIEGLNYKSLDLRFEKPIIKL